MARIIGTGAAFALLFALSPLSTGCSGVVNAVEGGTVTVVCSVHPDSGAESCSASRNVPSSEKASLQNECANSGGTLVSQCPSAGLVGCCTLAESNFAIETCSYSGVASEVRNECGTGTWSTTP